MMSMLAIYLSRKAWPKSMKASEIPNIKIYWGMMIESGCGKPLRVCSFLPQAALEAHLKLRQYEGLITAFSFNLVEPQHHHNIKIDNQWLFLQDNHTLTSIENLYVGYLAGIF